MLTIQRIVAVAISFLYVYFINKIVSVFLIEKKEWNSKESYKKLVENEDLACFTRFVCMIIAGLVAVVVAFFSEHPEFQISAALSGLLCILWATWTTWGKFREDARLIVAGGALVVLTTILLRN